MTVDRRDDVRMVRRAMRTLVDPAPALLAGLADAETMVQIASDLPAGLTLVECSPFATLPREPGARPDVSAGAARLARGVSPSWPPGGERRSVGEPAATTEARPISGVTSPAAPARASARAAVLPVFPLRRQADAASGIHQSERADRGERRVADSAALPSVGAAGRHAVPAAEKALALGTPAGPAERESPRAPKSADATTSSPPWPRVDREEADLAGTLTAMPPAAWPEASGSPGQSDSPEKSSSEQRPARPTGVSLLAALADAALASSPDGHTAPESLAPPPRETARLSVQPAEPRSGPVDVRLDAAAPARPTAVIGGEEGGAAVALDPRLLASLVNDVLVEQARRHGVDLS